ncbi:MAG: biotin-independent malonate decarboxylase subunit beta [Deltaproteobacteria bacterium]|nr:biotin-independent malonate decarboxylase subunit beta [Deltaproteobacteria bacterium]
MSAPPAPRRSYREAGARRRLLAVLDPGSFRELVGPAERVQSPHLAALDLPAAFDDGVAVGRGTLQGRPVLAASQEGAFLGGAVGEVHGAKLTGLLRLAAREQPAGVVLLLDSGGVRLQEANAGLLAVSEILRALLAARAAGVPVVGLIGGGWGCFGGMGIVGRCCDGLAMSEEGRLGLSGPEVIETTCGVEELDTRDRALVWRLYGGKHRIVLGEADLLVEDDLAAFRAAAASLLTRRRVLTLERLCQAQEALEGRLADFGSCADPVDLWAAAGVVAPAELPLLEPEPFLAAVARARRPVP